MRKPWRPIETMPKKKPVMVGWSEQSETHTAIMSRKELPRPHGWTHWRPIARCPTCGRGQ